MNNVNRRQVIAATGGTALATALAGCSSLLQSDDAGEGSGEVADVPDEPVEGFFQLFLEGSFADTGLMMRYGAEEAVERINENGGVGGRQLNVEFVHEGGSQQSNYQNFVEQGADVTFGPISSGGAASMAPVVEEEGVINVVANGVTPTLFEETLPDPEYMFRFSPNLIQEVVGLARDTVNELGADNINTIAGINPNYAYGQNAQRAFVTVMQTLTGAEVVHEGFPDLGASDLSSHISSVNNEEPDILFTSQFGADLSLLLDQGQGQGLFDNIGLLAASAGATLTNQGSEGAVDSGEILATSRNWYFDNPPLGQWSPGQEFFDSIQSKHDVVPTQDAMSGYGTVALWATAADKAVQVLGRWPSQEEIASFMEGHGFFIPQGHVVCNKNHQCKHNTVTGKLAWQDEHDVVGLDEVSIYSDAQATAPPGQNTFDWLDSW